MSEQGIFELDGLDKLLENLDARKLLAGPITRFLTRCAMITLNKAKERAPVDTGRLWTSLTYGRGDNVEMDTAEPPLSVRVGTNVQADGFPYPKALDEGEQYHYRGKAERGTKSWGLYGEPTKGWFSDVPGLLSDQYGEAGEAMLNEIGESWGK